MLSKRLLIAVFLSLVVTNVWGANLLVNGKFDTNDLTGWDVNLTDSRDVVTVQSAVVYDGSPALFMRSRSGSWTGALARQTVNVSGLTEVTFSCMANKPIGGNWGDVRVDLNWYSGDPCDANNYLSWEEWPFITGNGGTVDWDFFSHLFTVPSTAQYVVFGLRADNWIWNVWMDDVFFGTPDLNQPILLAPPPGASISKEDKSNCGYGPTLSWIAATAATGDHYVYFGTSFAEVNDATTGSPQFKGTLTLGTTSYTLSLSDVEKGRAYYWRVDETVGANVIKSLSVWPFSVSNVTWIDTFNTYSSDAAIQAVWGPNSMVLDANMRLSYTSTKYAVSANTSALLCSNDINSNTMLALMIKGHDNFKDPNKLYVKLESNNGAQSGIVYYPESNALNQQSYESMILWPIALRDFASQGVVLTNVSKITIGISNSGGSPIGTGNIFINDIRLDYSWCNTSLAELIPADFTKNCYVGMEDLDLLANDWLTTSTQVTASAPTTGPILWYQCNEGAGYDPLDSSGNHYDGFISNLNAWGGPGTSYDGTNCVYLNNANWIEITDLGVNNNHAIGAESTVSFWLKDPGQAETGGSAGNSTILQIGTEGHSINIWSGATGAFSYKAGWDTVLGYGDTLDVGLQGYTNPDHPQDRWVHYAFIKSLSRGYMRVFRDGRLIAQSTASASETPVADGVNGFASIGAWRYSGGTGGYYSGWIDDFRIYGYALEPNQVLYLAVQGGTATSPMTQGLLTNAEATGDGKVNFNDFAVMANYWLQQVTWP